MNDTDAIKIENLYFSYDSHNVVLNLKKLRVSKYEKHFLYGPSGHGKSTLLNLIAGVLPHNKGHIQVLGEDYSSLSSHAKNKLRGHKMGHIFQNFNLIPYLNVKENILLPARLFGRGQSWQESLEECHQFIKTLGMSEHANKLPTQLSIGQQQRVAQARALLGRPQLIVADEPTSSLDEKNTDEFMKLLIEHCQKKQLTLLFVSHDHRLKSYFDASTDLNEVNEVAP